MRSGVFTFDPLTLSDLPFLIEIRNECRDFLHDNRIFTLQECERWFKEAKPDFRVIRFDQVPIGYFRLSHYDPETGSIYIGADLHRDFRGRGLAEAAYKAFIPVLFDEYKVSRLRLEVLSHNSAAKQLYEKLGFEEIERKTDFSSRNGVSVDSIVMQLELGTDKASGGCANP